METHERFFGSKERECIDELDTVIKKGGFYDLHGTAKEPTFVKI